MEYWNRYARPILTVFAAWAAVKVGFFYYLSLTFPLLSNFQSFSGHWQLWLITIFGPPFLYYLACGALLQRFFVKHHWLQIVLIVALLQSFVDFFAHRTFSFVIGYEPKPEYSEFYLFNILTSEFAPLFAIPLGAYLGKWVAELMEQRAVGVE